MSAWTYQGKEWEPNPDEPYESFVYLITDLENGFIYVGKKGLYTNRTLPPLKGQKKKRKVKKESDWRDYYSSNDTIKELAQSTPDRFKREILHLCTTPALASYLEAKEQFVREVLEIPNSYNGWIMVRSRRNHLPQNQVPKPVKIPKPKKVSVSTKKPPKETI